MLFGEDSRVKKLWGALATVVLGVILLVLGRSLAPRSRGDEEQGEEVSVAGLPPLDVRDRGETATASFGLG